MENSFQLGDLVNITAKNISDIALLQRLTIIAWSSNGNAICLKHTSEHGTQTIEVDTSLLEIYEKKPSTKFPIGSFR